MYKHYKFKSKRTLKQLTPHLSDSISREMKEYVPRVRIAHADVDGRVVIR
jgi:hypothetical protein